MEYGAQHGITDQFGMDLPETQVEEQDLAFEKNAAKFSKSKEYQALKEHLESRIDHYKTQLPGGKPIVEANAQDWIVANLVIGEFQAVLQAYENAQQVVKEANAKRQTG